MKKNIKGICNTKEYFNSYWITLFIDMFFLILGITTIIMYVYIGVVIGILK